MPTFVPYVALFSVAAFLSGALLNWLAYERKNRRERAALAAEIKKRYAAYLSIEARMSQAIQQFDHYENELADKLSTQREQIKDLNRALNAHEGLAELDGSLDFHEPSAAQTTWEKVTRK